jgi:maltose alpha-D-glucosyltransferase/alpha-amylase
LGLVGALPVPEEAVKGRVGDGDYRWVNRGGVDLMGANTGATESAFGLPRAPALYGPLPGQLRDPDSFASQLKRMLAARRHARVAEGDLLAVPEPKAASLCVLVLRLPDRPLAVTTLNFGREDVEEELDLGEPGKSHRGRRCTDLLTGRPAGEISGEGRLRVRVPALSGTTFLIEGPP